MAQGEVKEVLVEKVILSQITIVLILQEYISDETTKASCLLLLLPVSFPPLHLRMYKHPEILLGDSRGGQISVFHSLYLGMGILRGGTN